MANPKNAGDDNSGSEGELSGGSGGTNCLKRFINKGIIKNVTFVSLIFFTLAEIVLSLNPNLLHKWLIDASICLTSTLLSGLCANFVSITFIYVFNNPEKNYSHKDIVRTGILNALVILKYRMGRACFVDYRSTPKYLSYVPLFLDLVFYVVDYFMSPKSSMVNDFDSELESRKKALYQKFKGRNYNLKRDIRSFSIRVADFESSLHAKKKIFAKTFAKKKEILMTRLDNLHNLQSSLPAQKKTFAKKKTKFVIRLLKLNGKSISLTKEISDLEDKVYALEREIQRLDGNEAQNNTLVAEKVILGFIIKGLKEDKDKLIQKNIALTETVSGLRGQIVSGLRGQMVSGLRDQISALNKEKNQILNGVEVQINNIVQERYTQKGLLDKILTELERLKEDNDSFNGETIRLIRRLSELKGEKSQLENEKSDIEKVLKKENDDEFEGEKSQLANEISDMEKVLRKENYDELEGEKSQMENDISDMEKVLKEVRDEFIVEEPHISLNEKNGQREKANVTDS